MVEFNFTKKSTSHQIFEKKQKSPKFPENIFIELDQIETPYGSHIRVF